MRNLPLAKVYQKLEPGPVVLLTTAIGGRQNVMVMSWHMMVEFVPPLIACIVSGGNYSHAALRKTRECVIAIPSAELAEKVVRIGMLGPRCRQVRDDRPDAKKGGNGCSPARQGMRGEHRMPRGRYTHGW